MAIIAVLNDAPLHEPQLVERLAALCEQILGASIQEPRYDMICVKPKHLLANPIVNLGAPTEVPGGEPPRAGTTEILFCSSSTCSTVQRRPPKISICPGMRACLIGMEPSGRPSCSILYSSSVTNASGLGSHRVAQTGNLRGFVPQADEATGR